MSNEAVFHLRLLEKYQIIYTEGTHLISVASTVTENNLIADENPRYLVSLRVLTPLRLENILMHIPDETARVPFSTINKYFMSGAIWERDIDVDELPVKGEKVIATFENVKGELLCTNIELLPREELTYLKLNDIDAFRQTLIDLIDN